MFNLHPLLLQKFACVCNSCSSPGIPIRDRAAELVATRLLHAHNAYHAAQSKIGERGSPEGCCNTPAHCSGMWCQERCRHPNTRDPCQPQFMPSSWKAHRWTVVGASLGSPRCSKERRGGPAEVLPRPACFGDSDPPRTTEKHEFVLEAGLEGREGT